MLEMVKIAIKDSPFISFGQYFTEYVFQVQDMSIENESKFVYRNNRVDPILLNRIMNEELRW